jgi:hypothetical protein
MLGKALWGRPHAGWIVVRNTSATEACEFVLCQSSNTLDLAAENALGQTLPSKDGFGVLLGNDVLIPRKLGPGEQLEFPIDPVTFSWDADQVAPSVQVPREEKSCRVWYNLDQVIRPKNPLKAFSTGQVLMCLVSQGPPISRWEALTAQGRADAETQARADLLAKVAAQAKVIPEITQMQDKEGTMLVITRGLDRVRIYAPGELTHTLVVTTRPKEDGWSLQGEISMTKQDGTVAKLPVSWGSDRPDLFECDRVMTVLWPNEWIKLSVGGVWREGTRETPRNKTPAKRIELIQTPGPRRFFIRIKPDGTAEEMSIKLFDWEGDEMPRLRAIMTRDDQLAVKYVVSRNLAKQEGRLIDWIEEQPDGELMVRLRVFSDGRIVYLPTLEQQVQRKVESVALKELVESVKSMNTFVSPLLRKTEDGGSRFRSKISMNPPFKTCIQLEEMETEAGSTWQSFQHWSPQNGVMDNSYERIKTRLLELVK